MSALLRKPIANRTNQPVQDRSDRIQSRSSRRGVVALSRVAETVVESGTQAADRGFVIVIGDDPTADLPEGVGDDDQGGVGQLRQLFEEIRGGTEDRRHDHETRCGGSDLG